MKGVCLLLLASTLAVSLVAESPAAGLWAGRFPDRLPAVTLQVKDEAGRLSGNVTFYVNRSGEIVGAETRPLIHPRFASQVLAFEVTRPSDGETLRFEMRLVNADEGELTGEGQVVKMKRVE